MIWVPIFFSVVLLVLAIADWRMNRCPFGRAIWVVFAVVMWVAWWVVLR